MNDILQTKGLLLKTGTAVDATLISAPNPTRNKSDECDPNIKETRKGNNWCFGMKAHICGEAASGLVHSVVANQPT